MISGDVKLCIMTYHFLMGKLEIRKATFQDAPGILRAHQNSIREIASKDHSVDQISAWSDHLTAEGYIKAMRSGEEYYIALDDEKVIGFSAMKNSTVMAVYVSSEGAGRGVGKALYYILEREAARRNLTKFSLTSSLTARGFYKKLGFVELEEVLHKFKSGVTVKCFRMEKNLKCSDL